MFMLWRLKKERAIPDIPIYMDSPMGRNILDTFKNNMEWHKLTMDECDSMCKDITLVQKMEDTYELAAKTHPKIIIAGSGMASGGRVLTYFQFYLANPTATILLAGYQAEGTRGRKMLEGATEVKLYGKVYEVKATVENIEGLSAHADQSELIDWMSKIKEKPEKIFVVHGEKKGAEGLQKKLKEVYGWDSTIPKLYDIVEVK
jgi:metallo-beta-lactamase family protein